MAENGASGTNRIETLAKAVQAIKTAQDLVIVLRSLMAAVLSEEVTLAQANTLMAIADRMLKVVKMQVEYQRDGDLPQFFEIKKLPAGQR